MKNRSTSLLGALALAGAILLPSLSQAAPIGSTTSTTSPPPEFGACCASGSCFAGFENAESCAGELSLPVFAVEFTPFPATCSTVTCTPATTTTTLPPPPIGACCLVAGGCQVLQEPACLDGNGTFQGLGTSCTEPGICVPETTTTLPPTTTTTLPATGACCAAGDCFVAQPGQCTSGTYQGDGTTCTPGICSVCGNGIVEAGEECDDADTASGDGCDATCDEEACWACVEPLDAGGPRGPVLGGSGPSVCSPDTGASCDDGDPCTVNDGCSTGSCTGEEVLIPAACEWVMVGGDPSRSVMSRTRPGTTVTGDICGETTRTGGSAVITGDIVAVASTGNGSFFGPAADVIGDIVTDGAAVVGKPRGTILPGLAVDTLAGGTSAVQSGDPTREYDALGTSVRADECNDAQADIDSGAAAIDAMPSTEDRGDVKVKGNQTLTINATNVGGLNVIDFKRLQTGNNATITLDGGGNAATVFVLRIEKKFDLHFGSDLVLVNGATPGNLVIYSGSKCKVGEDTTGAGTLLCPDGKLLVEERAVWNGALLGGRKLVQLREGGVLTHAPLQIGG